jgi:hypothetical protein
MMNTSYHICWLDLTQSTTRLCHLLPGEWSQLASLNSIFSSWHMKTDWIFNQGVKACLNLQPTIPLEDEVVPSGDVVAVAHSFKEKNKFPPCQLCGRTNHSVFKCYKCFAPNYMGEEKSSNTAHSYGVDSNWYADSGATDHVTGELDKLAIKDSYQGGDQIYTASGLGMHINHIGRSIIHTPYRDLHLNNILHIPQSS